MNNNRNKIEFFKAINEGLDLSLKSNSKVYLMGLGVPDPTGIFGTTLGLQKKYGKGRVMDMPLSENAMTGVAIGTALGGLRPVISHQRVEFALLSIEQIVNQAAKWFYMSAGQNSIPLVIRLIVGRGWGQGPQHAQNLESWFSHIPGLKVVSPCYPYDAKGLLISSIKDNNPIIFFENRWLHNTFGKVPKESYSIELGKAKTVLKGKDITIISHSYMFLEALKCAKFFRQNGISVELIDLRTLRPLDKSSIIKSVKKTGRVIVVDNGWLQFGVSSEIISIIVENIFGYLKTKPARLGMVDTPCPSTRGLANHYYPRAIDIANKINNMLKTNIVTSPLKLPINTHLDIPDPKFKGPF
mgnify:CR=1 FL=1